MERWRNITLRTTKTRTITANILNHVHLIGALSFGTSSERMWNDSEGLSCATGWLVPFFPLRLKKTIEAPRIATINMAAIAISL